MSFDPEAYSIVIRKETIDGEVFYVGRVAEFPNISAFEATYDEAHSLVLDAIGGLYSIAEKKGETLPDPYPPMPDECSGRVTLRLPKTLHARVVRYADRDDVSLNTYLVSAISTYVGEEQGHAKAIERFGQYLQDYVQAAWIRTSTSFSESRTVFGSPTKRMMVLSSQVERGAHREITNSWPAPYGSIKKFDAQVTAHG
jgi:predicted RNase H-like HicB family nuclease